MRFYAGHDRPNGAADLDRMMIAAHNVTAGLKPPRKGWMLDSGGFTQLTRRGLYDDTPRDYVRFVMDAAGQVPGLDAAIQQDYPASEAVDDATPLRRHEAPGLSRLATRTRARYLHTVDACDELGCDVEIAPALQGQSLEDYRRHLSLTQHLLTPGQLVAIGNLKADGHGPGFLRDLLLTLPGTYRYHALGIGKHYLNSSVGSVLRRRLWSADSAAWKVRARYAGHDQNGTAFARSYADDLTRSAPLFA
jgi:hypothetical protein